MKRTHVVAFYDPGAGAATENSRGKPRSSWALVHDGVEANLQPLTGGVRQAAAGREIDATWRGFIPSGIAVKEDFGVVVLEGVGPQRYRVVQVGEHGGKWDTELMLKQTAEVFPEPAP